MKKKIAISFVMFFLLLISVVFANSYVQALSKEEKLEIKKEIIEQDVKDNKISQEQANQIYQNIEQRITNCNYNCESNENCPLYHQNNNCINKNANCINQNNQYSQKNYNCRRNCAKEMCNR